MTLSEWDVKEEGRLMGPLRAQNRINLKPFFAPSCWTSPTAARVVAVPSPSISRAVSWAGPSPLRPPPRPLSSPL